MTSPVRTLIPLALLAVATRTAAADKPAWCSTKGILNLPKRRISTIDRETASDALKGLVFVICNADRFKSDVTAEINTARAKVNARLALTDAEWSDVGAWAIADPTDLLTFAKIDEKLAWSSAGAIDQYGAMELSSNGENSYGEPAYVADAFGDRISQAARVKYVDSCIKRDNPVEWAACQSDIDALDMGKLAAELRADQSRGAVARIELRVRADDLRTKLVAHAEKVKALQAKDQAFVKMFAIAKDARADFAAKSDPKLLQLALAMDDARVTNSNQRYAGCIDRTLPAFEAQVAAVPATQWAGFKTDPPYFLASAVMLLLGSPNAYLATNAFYTCAAGSEANKDQLVGAIAEEAGRWSGYRGPRTAAESAIMMAGLTFDDRDTKLRPAGVTRGWFSNSNASGGGGGRGLVVKVTTKGDKVDVEYKQTKRKETVCTKWQDTNRVVGITAGGTVQYDYNCLAYGSITVEDGLSPRSVLPRYAAGLKAGVLAAALGEVAIAVWPSGDKTPTYVFGVPVK